MRPSSTLATLAIAPLLFLAACGTASGDPTMSAPAATQAGAAFGVRALPPAAALALIEERSATVLDVRTPQEYGTGHLSGARNVALGANFASAVSALPRAGTYVVYCASGNRSKQAVSIMSKLGFTDVVDAGGLKDLAGAGAQIVT